MKFIGTIESPKFLGKGSLAWHLKDDVNILSGENGMGKTTLLKIISLQLTFDARTIPYTELLMAHINDPLLYDISVRIYDRDSLEYEKNMNGNIVLLDFSDTRFSNSEVEKKMIATHPFLKTRTDVLLYGLLKKYTQYLLNLKARLDIKRTAPVQEFRDYFETVYAKDYLFKQTIDNLFKVSGKHIFPASEYSLAFSTGRSTLTVYQLSSGEKNLLAMVLTALLFDGEPSILLINRPETSLHISIQKQLIDTLRFFAPNTQLIIATHAPAIIAEYQARTVNIEDLIYNRP